MRQTIVNLALPVVHETIEEVLATYPVDHHQKTLATVDVRERLVAFVISRLPARYVTLDESTATAMGAPMHCYSLDQHRQIKQLVHQGIQKVLHSPMVMMGPAAPSASVGMEPSNWFG